MAIVTKLFTVARISLLLVIALLTIAGCSEQTDPQTNDSTVESPDNPDVLLVSTTTTQDSGLLDILIPEFEKKTGYHVKLIAVGSGAALAMGEKGEADVLLTHAPSSEKKLVRNNDVIDYRLVMFNDFVIVGPPSDPARIKGMKSAIQAFQTIADSKSLFISRGDDSGTHKSELSLWGNANIHPSGTWYQESGSGQGQTLSIASQKEGYMLTDRGTYLSLQEKLSLDILVEGDSPLFNIYHVMQVNPEKFPKVNTAGAKAFVDFIVDQETQKQIGEYGKDKFGQPLFFPAADKKEEDF